MIETLRDVTLTGRHTRNSTTFDVFAEGRESTPVARLHKDHLYTSKHALSVLTGPGLDQLEGWVTPRWAARPDRVRIGTVDQKSGGLFGDGEWTFEQEGLSLITGRPTGMTKVRYGGPLGWTPMIRTMDMLFTYRVRFQSADSEGFEFARLTGARHPRYSLRIHDARISTMLALATIVYYDRVLDDAPRKGLMGYWGSRFGGDQDGG